MSPTWPAFSARTSLPAGRAVRPIVEANHILIALNPDHASGCSSTRASSRDVPEETARLPLVTRRAEHAGARDDLFVSKRSSLTWFRGSVVRLSTGADLFIRCRSPHRRLSAVAAARPVGPQRLYQLFDEVAYAGYRRGLRRATRGRSLSGFPLRESSPARGGCRVGAGRIWRLSLPSPRRCSS